jgi:hypothetical protein
MPQAAADHAGTVQRKELTMSIFASPRFLRYVLLADAASGAATALLQLTAGAALASLLGLPQGLARHTWSYRPWLSQPWPSCSGWGCAARPSPAGPEDLRSR